MRSTLRGTNLVSLVIAAIMLAALGATAQAAFITVSPGTGPAGGYLPLSAFGITPLGGVSDDSVVDVPVSPYNYAGAYWTSVGVASNGFVIVGGSTGPALGSAPNQSLPNPVPPNNVLAPYWTDLDPTVTGAAIRVGQLTDGAHTWVVVDWNGVPDKINPGTNSFEIWLRVNDIEDVVYSYGTITAATPALLTVGAEDITGTVGASRYFNGIGTAPSSNSELRVASEGLPEPTSPAIMLCVGSMALLRGRRRKG